MNNVFPVPPAKCVSTDCEYGCCVGNSCGTNVFACNSGLVTLCVIIGAVFFFVVVAIVIWKTRTISEESVTMQSGLAMKATCIPIIQIYGYETASNLQSEATNMYKLQSFHVNNSIAADSTIINSSEIMEDSRKKYECEPGPNPSIAPELGNFSMIPNYCIQKDSSNSTGNFLKARNIAIVPISSAENIVIASLDRPYTHSSSKPNLPIIKEGNENEGSSERRHRIFAGIIPDQKRVMKRTETAYSGAQAFNSTREGRSEIVTRSENRTRGGRRGSYDDLAAVNF